MNNQYKKDSLNVFIQKDCEFCKSVNDENKSFFTDSKDSFAIISKFDNILVVGENDKDKPNIEVTIKYCPNCGRKLK